MSTLLYKTQCPECAKKGKDRTQDNLAVYADHSFCYSCGYVILNNNIRSKLNAFKTAHEKKVSTYFPPDITTELPNKAKEWLEKYMPLSWYGTLFWSDEKQSVLFPINNVDGYAIASIDRYFGEDKEHSKWIINGINSDLLHIIGVKSNSICLVEDLVSAIKVSKVTQSAPIFGSAIGLSRLSRLMLLGIEHIYIWLDWDKRSEAIVEANRAMSLGLSVKVIHTYKDPKEYSLDEIKHELSISTESPV